MAGVQDGGGQRPPIQRKKTPLRGFQSFALISAGCSPKDWPQGGARTSCSGQWGIALPVAEGPVAFS